MTTITTIADATKRVQDFYNAKQAILSGGRTASTQFQTASRRRVYSMIGDAAEAIIELMSNEEVFGQLLQSYNTSQIKDDNIYSAGIRVLFRKKQNGKDIPDRSAWKYSKVIRYGLEQGWKPTAEKTLGDVFADKLEALSLDIDGKTVKRMLAAELQDTKNHGNRDAEEEAKVEAAALGFMTKQPGLGVFGANLGVDAPKNGQLVNVVASFDAATGQWVVRAVANAKHDSAWASIKKDVIADFNKRLDAFNAQKAGEQMVRENITQDELEEQLAQHNVEVDANNATVGTFRKMVVWERTSDGLFDMPSEHIVPVTDQDNAAQETSDSNAA